MDNKTKFKTRLAAVQLVSQQLINKEDIELLKVDFDNNYRNTKLEQNSEKITYNINFLSKIIGYYKIIKFENISIEIDNLINFKRNFAKWDTLNQAIILVSISEIRNSNKDKTKIILNDYLEISKFFVTTKETKLINSILDKLIYDKK